MSLYFLAVLATTTPVMAIFTRSELIWVIVACFLIFLVLLVIFYLIYRLMRQNRDDKDEVLPIKVGFISNYHAFFREMCVIL